MHGATFGLSTPPPVSGCSRQPGFSPTTSGMGDPGDGGPRDDGPCEATRPTSGRGVPFLASPACFYGAGATYVVDGPSQPQNVIPKFPTLNTIPPVCCVTVCLVSHHLLFSGAAFHLLPFCLCLWRRPATKHRKKLTPPPNAPPP